MSERTLEGHFRGTPTAQDAHRIHALLARLVVPPSEFHVPLRMNPDAWGMQLHPQRLKDALRRLPTVADEWSPAWERLEAQVALCVASGDIAAAAGYAFRMLFESPPTRTLLHWEGLPGASRMWIRRGLWMTPVPLQSAVEGILWSWWALSGGFHNYGRSLLPTPEYPLTIYPHHRPEDREALDTHPSRIPWAEHQWLGPREGEDLTDVFGVLYDASGRPVRPTHRGPRAFDWREHADIAFGLRWLDEATHHLGDALYRQARAHRLEMRHPARSEG